MPLMQCMDCGAAVSDQAVMCPHCGRRVKGGFHGPYDGFFLKVMNILILIELILFALFLLLALVTGASILNRFGR